MCNVRVDPIGNEKSHDVATMWKWGEVKSNPFVSMPHPWTDGMSTSPADVPYPSSGFVPTNRFGGSNVQTFFPDRSGPLSFKYLKAQLKSPLELIHCHCRHSMSKAIRKVQGTVQRPNRVPTWSACIMKTPGIELYRT